MLIATRVILEFGIQHSEAFSDDAYAKMVNVSQAHKKAYELAIKAGVRIALEIDRGKGSVVVRYNYGINGGELSMLSMQA